MNRRFVLVVVLVLVIDWLLCLRGRVGSWSQCMRKNERGLSMNRSAELQFGNVFRVRRAAIVPNRSSALHPSAYGTDTTGVFPSGPGTCHSVMIFSPSIEFTGYQVSSFNRRTKINDCAAPRLIRLPDGARDSWPDCMASNCCYNSGAYFSR